MAWRTHLGLRFGALALLVAVGLWPRTPARHAVRPSPAAHELVRTSMPHTLDSAARAVRKPAPAPAPPDDEVVADVDDSMLTN